MSLCVSTKLTVYFEDPFWVGVFERKEKEQLEVCRVVFGSEPKTVEVYEFLQKNYFSLSFSRPIQFEKKLEKKKNPKRLQREIKKSIHQNGVSTKAQEAMRIERESNKIERKKQSKDERERVKKALFQKKQKKKKQKKKGH